MGRGLTCTRPYSKINGEFSTIFYEDATLDEVRKSFIDDLRNRGFTIDTPIVGWRETGIVDGVKQMRFVFERYYMFDDSQNHAVAEIHDNSFHL